MGKLPTEHRESFARCEKFAGLKFQEVKTPTTLEKRYLGKLDKDALDFMNGCLQMSAKDRWTASEAVNHPFFKEFNFANLQIEPVSRSTSATR